MEIEEKKLIQFHLLLDRLFDDEANEEEVLKIQEFIQKNLRLQQYYFRCVELKSGLHQSKFLDTAYYSPEQNYHDIFSELAEYEKIAPAIEIPQEKPQRELIEKVIYPPREKRKLSKFSIFILLNAAAVILFFLFLRFAPSKEFGIEVATLTDSFNAKWAGEDSMQNGKRLCTDRTSLFLIEGLAEVVFDNKTQVTIEGPAEFKILTEDRIGLDYGKVYTMVSKEATGFSVYTQNAKIIDLGTEFGVHATSRGETNLFLYKGKASLVPVSPQQTLKSQILYQGQSKCVTSTGNVDTISFKEDEFVRNFDSENAVLWNGENLNLAYVASGGNGFESVALNMGIDQATGELVMGNDEEQFRGVPGVKGYTRVPDLPYVDGVFVPDGEHGPVQLTSEGHAFDGFPDTDGQYFMSIGAFSYVNLYTADGRKYSSLHLKGYPEETSVNLCLHANSGITYDLQKIRQAMPFVNITRFSSVYGIPKTREDQDDVDADFYVFVDGLPRMVKQGVSNQDDPGHMEVSLTAQDHFLTLVCTQGNNNFGDWSLFVNPALELESAD